MYIDARHRVGPGAMSAPAPSGRLGGYLGQAPATARRNVICYGYSGAPGDGSKDRDGSNMLVAHTLQRHLKKRFPGDRIEVHCIWHKHGLVNALLNGAEKIRQIHYVGHGNGGGLWMGYRHPKIKEERNKLGQWLRSPLMRWLPDWYKRWAALQGEPGLVSGYLAKALDRKALTRIKSNLASDAMMHIWGCFAGARDHTFDPDWYWGQFNGGASSVPGVARDLATTLKIDVTAAFDPQSIAGMNYWYRDPRGRLHADRRPKRLPQWLWPSKRARWITYDRTGSGDTGSIRFLGSRVAASRLKPGTPPSWFRDEIPRRPRLGSVREACVVSPRVRVP